MGSVFAMRTKRGYPFGEVASALQKSIRRGDARMACYWATELHESGYGAYLWKRLITISAEDVAAPIATETVSLYQQWEFIYNTAKPGTNTRAGARLFPAKACILMAQAPKSRDADHATCFAYDQKSGLTDEQILADLDEARKDVPAIPEYAYDVHTAKGRAMGKTRETFFVEEHNALSPRAKGLFDSDVEALSASKGRRSR